MKIFKSDELRFTKDFNDMIKIVLLNSLGFFFISFWIPVIARTNMNATGIQLSLVVSVQVLGRMISGFFTGFITDRIKSRTILVLIGSYGRAISYFIIYAAIIANLMILLGIGTFFLGFMAGIFWVPFNTFVAEKSNKDNRSQAYGKRDSANAIGQIIGSLLGFNLVMIAGVFTNKLFIIYSAIPVYGIGNFIAGLRFHRRVDESIKFLENSYENKTQINKSSNKSSIFHSRAIIIGVIFLMSVLFLGSINSSIARPFLNIYLLENIESNVNLVIWAYLPAGILATLFAPKLGAIVDRIRPSIGITVVSSLGALVTWLLINSANIWIFAGLLLVDMTIMIAAGLIFQNLVSRISTEHRGKILGIGEFFAFLGSFIGPILGGIVWDFMGPKFPFIISIFVELSLIPLYLVVVFYLLPHLAESYYINHKRKEIKT
ncbi:MAG: MFS transporter [Candidatus Hermodarchaeota archaeon]